MTSEIALLVAPIRRIHERIRDAVVAGCERSATHALSRVARDGAGDTIYAVDRVAERALVAHFRREEIPAVLVAEGLPGVKVSSRKPRWRVIVDPIDGTRGLMYQKRSAWILTAVAPDRGAKTTLEDVELAVQTEIPLVKQHLSDSAWAIRGRGAHAERWNRLTRKRGPLRLRPSSARTIAHGFAMIARFFPGARETLAAIDDEIVRRALGPVKRGKAACFEDQYVSTGGQLWELMSGHDRFVADLRPLVGIGICCHPYDVCTELIAREVGVIVTEVAGGPLCAPLDVEHDVAWAGYANAHVRAQVEPLLVAALRKRKLL
ncbi:MAG: inositol monophosphatase [Planctomycetes bacterium]|nr:inositol monophosphatase [Planctomycetota bacterium]MBI3844718.1 inositol monophosphatase [Planctomycetota bacterium]